MTGVLHLRASGYAAGLSGAEAGAAGAVSRAFPGEEVAMHRIGNDWFHWGIGSSIHFGFHRRGNCWRLWKFEVSRYGTCTFYNWWRFFISIQKRPDRA